MVVVVQHQDRRHGAYSAHTHHKGHVQSYKEKKSNKEKWILPIQTAIVRNAFLKEEIFVQLDLDELSETIGA